METVVVQLTNSKAYSLLKDLEELRIIKLITRSTPSSQKLSEKADALQHCDTQSREEWNNRST
jgi:hypothetical protein